MTLAGTRPPTVDEWEKYELHHRARLAAKPGLTGMWQVSGRSNITDFEEVVELDREYISQLFNRIAELVPDARFVWIGNGELENELSAPNIEVTGWKPRKEALAKI